MTFAAGRTAGPRIQYSATRSSNLIELVGNEVHHQLMLLARCEHQANGCALTSVLVGATLAHVDRGSRHARQEVR